MVLPLLALPWFPLTISLSPKETKGGQRGDAASRLRGAPRGQGGILPKVKDSERQYCHHTYI